MSTKIQLVFAAAALALTGCARMATQPGLPHSNPASPCASAASYPAATPVLMAGTNFAMGSQAEEQPAPAAHPDMMHDKSMQHEHHHAPDK
jgi:hypothetical protein